ncbi:glutaredoxin domain-containing protein [Microbacterium thalli]|uniref:Glutaredoxin domain-containing protein n=1 Tax=Microbacterium thalli TaxID=3027921 RepID=A0ABT5SM73_9MICO|nr:glutaredoxin domain-containing protein [Microbacterium thalli]MDD7963575.1 glutaredoxin domain-containing protein [Microbacterium thalli]MDN8549553.1 glutaredoxin domain-containing protein [Microbacterium thalli]
MSIHVTVYGAEGCTKCTNTCIALRLAGIDFDLVDVHAAGLVDELRIAGVQELPLVVTDDGDRWTGLRLDKTVELRRGSVDEIQAERNRHRGD